MPLTLLGTNPENPSSRFTLNPAIVVFVEDPSSVEARNDALRLVFGEAIFSPEEPRDVRQSGSVLVGWIAGAS